MKKSMEKTIIKVKTFSKYKLIDGNDLYHKIGKYLENKKMMFCFTELGQLISRYDCEDHGYVFKDGIYD